MLHIEILIIIFFLLLELFYYYTIAVTFCHYVFHLFSDFVQQTFLHPMKRKDGS